MGADGQGGASDKDRFDVLHGALTQFYGGLIDFEFKHGALLSVGLGWLITSDTARGFLSENWPVRWFATAAVLGLTAMHSFWVYKFYGKSENAYRMLLTLNFLPDDYFRDRRIQPYLPLTFVSVHAMFSLVICVLMWERQLVRMLS